MIELRQLRALLALEDFKSFSLAANSLATVQSNISAHLARLEETVGATLVDRRTGELTDEGKAVSLRARRLLAELEAIDSDISALRDDVRGRVRVGMIGTVARWFIPPLINEIEHRHPNLKVEVAEGTTTTLENRVLSNAFEFAIMTRPNNTDELLFNAVFEEELVLICDQDSPLAKKTVVSLDDLDSIPLLLPPKGTQFRDQIELIAAQGGVNLIPKAEIDGVRLLASMAFDGFAPTIAPATAIPNFMTSRLGICKVVGIPRRRVGVARRKRAAHSAAAKTLLALIDEFFTSEELSNKYGLPNGVLAIRQ
ncbi:MAG: LysR family transcriptional regulator [Actinomycetota bacterium]|nr:LysR family transcriptional regulator [Actinomycetota bacterium]